MIWWLFVPLLCLRGSPSLLLRDQSFGTQKAACPYLAQSQQESYHYMCEGHLAQKYHAHVAALSWLRGGENKSKPVPGFPQTLGAFPHVTQLCV